MRTIKYFLTALALLTIASCEEYPNYIEDSDFIIEQNSSLFAVYPIAQAVPADGGSYKIKVNGGESWTISLTESNSSAKDWCTVDKTSGSGAGEVTVTVTQSTSFVKNRSLILEFTNADKTKTMKHKVVQATLSLGEDEVMINGLIWSTKNVAAPGTFTNDIDEVGYCYQFNRKQGFPFANSVPEFAPVYSSYTPSESGWIDNAWTNDPCPEGWRVPTGAEVNGIMGESVAGLKASWVSKCEKNGFARNGFVAGIDKAAVSSVTKGNIKSMGGIFLPQSGWLTEGGVLDRAWLVALRTATSLNDNMGGMWLGNTGYVDCWGWGDGQKKRAAMVRCVKKITIED
jgi:hypothetical protein